MPANGLTPRQMCARLLAILICNTRPDLCEAAARGDWDGPWASLKLTADLPPETRKEMEIYFRPDGKLHAGAVACCEIIEEEWEPPPCPGDPPLNAMYEAFLKAEGIG